MTRDTSPGPFVAAFVLLVLVASVASAASSLSDAFTGFTGNSTQSATQDAVDAAGFNFFDHAVDSSIEFDASGAHFGNQAAGDIGRNYIRTNDADYANVSFVAEITFVSTDIDFQDGYFGLGSGDAEPTFRTPDYLTDLASATYWGEIDVADPFVSTMRNHNGDSRFDFVAAPGLGNGTHRLQLDYDWFRKLLNVRVDIDYAGGPFTADVAAPPLNTAPLYGPTGWPTEPSRIFFGGDEGIVFKDFQVDVSTPSLFIGDFDMNGDITDADWAILRTNQHANLSGNTFEEAYFRGDLTGDLRNNHADFVAFKTIYEQENGTGSFDRMLAGVPEPSSLLVLASAVGLTLFVRGGRQRHR
jgi:hypothetical protein